jgi:S1-C subfamily serine protease
VKLFCKMEVLRRSILQVNTICSEVKPEDPRVVEEVNEYSGTCFHVVPAFLEGCPFYSDNKLFFVTNFHVCDDADNRSVFLRTAAMGKSMFTAFVEAVVPKLDIAILSITRGGEHQRWFLPESPELYLDELRQVNLYPKRISSKTRKVSTIGFPQGLENQLSSGWLAGRGTDDEEYLQLNMSLNSGNSGGPLTDSKGNIIGVCAATLGDSEAISFAVPSYCVLKYFQNFYSAPYGKFPQWGIELLPMTEAYQKVHKIRGCGAVIKDIHPASIAVGVLKPGDVVHRVGGHQLDMFGLIVDSTRGSKITMNNTEFIMGLEDAEIEFSRKSTKKTVKLMPAPLHLKVGECYKEWNPVKVASFGPFVFQNLSLNLMTCDELPVCQSMALLQHATATKSMNETVVISKIDPNSYVASLEYPQEYDRIIAVNRTKITCMEDLESAFEGVKRMAAEGEKYFSLETSSGKMWLTINKILKTTKKRKRN